MYCAMHFIVGPWPGELLSPVWNNWALLVPWSQRVAEFSKIFGAGVYSCCGCSQLHRKALCAVIDWADALQSCWFLATLTDPSHYLLSSWGQVRIFPAFLRIMHWTILASHFFHYSTVLWFLCFGHCLNLLQKVELVLKYVLKAGSCIQGVGVLHLGHGSADL